MALKASQARSSMGLPIAEVDAGRMISHAGSLPPPATDPADQETASPEDPQTEAAILDSVPTGAADLMDLQTAADLLDPSDPLDPQTADPLDPLSTAGDGLMTEVSFGHETQLPEAEPASPSLAKAGAAAATTTAEVTTETDASEACAAPSTELQVVAEMPQSLPPPPEILPLPASRPASSSRSRPVSAMRAPPSRPASAALMPPPPPPPPPPPSSRPSSSGRSRPVSAMHRSSSASSRASSRPASASVAPATSSRPASAAVRPPSALSRPSSAVVPEHDVAPLDDPQPADADHVDDDGPAAAPAEGLKVAMETLVEAEEGVYEDDDIQEVGDNVIDFGLFQEELAHVVTEAMLQARRVEAGQQVGPIEAPEAPSVDVPAGANAPPSRRAVLEYAAYLGMDVASGADADLLYIAEWALTAPVPDGWSVHLDAEGLEFFHNVVTNESRYEHPMDAHYIRLYEQKRAFRRTAMEGSQGLVLSGTSARGIRSAQR